ncbi:MAG: biopolymer transporter ExbD [Myxococcaceae bacterium]|nr:biopolymer transporter ExbD [Myxococcaceae bacterium]
MRTEKRPLDTEINVVPFIDLMAVTIAFLLITAVWSQTGTLPVSQAGPGERADEVEAPPPRELKLTQAGLTLDGERVPVSELTARMQGVQSATIVTDDAVQYEALIQVIDACRAAKVEGIAVTPAS